MKKLLKALFWIAIVGLVVGSAIKEVGLQFGGELFKNILHALRHLRI